MLFNQKPFFEPDKIVRLLINNSHCVSLLEYKGTEEEQLAPK